MYNPVAQSTPSWQRSILAVNLFLLARGGVAAGLVVQATRNHATDSEQEEGDGQHWRRYAASLSRRARAPARDSLSANYVSWPDCLITKYRSRDPPRLTPAPACGRVCRNKMCSHCVFERRTL